MQDPREEAGLRGLDVWMGGLGQEDWDCRYTRTAGWVVGRYMVCVQGLSLFSLLSPPGLPP